MSRHSISAAIFALALGVSGLAGSQQPSSPADTEAFIAALDACTPSTVNTPHPLMRAFVVEHTVSGEKEGKCDYTQTMPGKMTMVCRLSADGRKVLAAELKVMTSGGQMRGGTNTPGPQWMKECEIELPSGSRIPAVQDRKP